MKEAGTRLILEHKERAILAAAGTTKKHDPNRFAHFKPIYDWILEPELPMEIEFRIQLIDTIASRNDAPQPAAILAHAKLFDVIVHPPEEAAPPVPPSAIPPQTETSSTSKKGIRRKKKTVG